MKILVNIIRIIVGVLFIFSGLVKANDPAGLSYKMHEFFEAWGMQGFNNWALTLSVLMIAFEIIAGIALLIGWQKKITIWLLLLLIIFFTFLTGYAWLSGKFKACGCFGDCIPIKSNESFFKDVALLLLIGFLFIFQKYIQPIFNVKVNASILVIGIAFSFLIQKYTLDHLPFKDCLSFKVGNNILEKKQFNAGKKDIVMIHKKDGKEYSYTVPNYPTWIEDSTYIFDRREEKVISTGNMGDIIMDFSLNSGAGTDTTKAILSQNEEIVLFLLTNIETDGRYSWESSFIDLIGNTKTKTIPLTDTIGPIFNKTFDDAHKNKRPLYIVTNRAEESRTFFAKYNVASDHILFCDEKPLLAAARTRPSILVIKNGVILEKLSYKDFGSLIKKWNTNNKTTK
jgi:uncharacterized membrane protein YphA (DoxX/SURF4 family)